MKAKSGWHGMLVTGLLITVTASGCLQTTIAGQALPSAYYLDDDVQYFPKGPEQKLANQIRALERYNAERESGKQGVNDGPLN